MADIHVARGTDIKREAVLINIKAPVADEQPVGKSGKKKKNWKKDQNVIARGRTTSELLAQVYGK